MNFMKALADTWMNYERRPGAVAFLASLIFFGSGSLFGQGLNWEGQTGVLVTPMAYTAASPKNNFGRPVVAYHFLNAGEVLGNFHTASVTVGIAGKAEFGYTRAFHQAGNTAGLSPLWNNGFNIVHGKINIIPENAGDRPWLPAITLGFASRTQVHHVSGILAGKQYNNNDFYVAATKTITQTKKVPLVLNFGFKVTNASVFGLTGQVPAYKGRMFAAAAFVVKGPAKSTLIFAAELAEQPRDIQNLPGVIIPTTLVYAVRFVPSPKAKLNLDIGVAQLAGKIAPGVDVKVRQQFAVGMSYAF